MALADQAEDYRISKRAVQRDPPLPCLGVPQAEHGAG